MQEILQIKKKRSRSSPSEAARRKCLGKIKRWRKRVLWRDFYRCVRCKSLNDLTAHHIKPWGKYPQLRFEVNNGITLCRSCHDIIERRK